MHMTATDEWHETNETVMRLSLYFFLYFYFDMKVYLQILSSMSMWKRVEGQASVPHDVCDVICVCSPDKHVSSSCS